MKKQNRSLVIIISIFIIYATLHSGEALQCYVCNSNDNPDCKDEPSSNMVQECSAPTQPSTQTTPSQTTPTEIISTQTSPTQTSPTPTSPTPTTPTPTTSIQTTLTETTSTETSAKPTSDESFKKNLKNNARDNRLRRSIFPNAYDAYDEEEQWCAVITRKLNDTEIIERGCVPFSLKCDNTNGETCIKCNSDFCNNANSVSINVITLSWVVFSWAIMFILIDS